jgi:hypothetical protein
MPINKRFRSLKWIEEYFLDLISGLKRQIKNGDPWLFVCGSAYIDYLTRTVNGRETGAFDYKKFLRDYFFKACPEYMNVPFKNTCTKMDVQMYHVLRCGIVHQFSLRPDRRGRSYGGRDRSILLAHGYKNNLIAFSNNRTRPPLDSVVLVAEHFLDDLEKVTKFVFMQARKRTSQGQLLRNNIRNWVRLHPPLGTDQVEVNDKK